MSCSPDQINLKIKGQDEGEMFFTMKRNMQLKKLMDAYCDRKSLDPSGTVFGSGGRLLSGEQTPDELEMKDGDEIYAFCWPARQSKRTRLSLSVLEGSSPLHPVVVHDLNLLQPRENEVSHTYTFDESQEINTRCFTQAMSLLNASFQKANEDSKKYIDEVKAKNELLKEANIRTEKKVAERDVTIKRMGMELAKVKKELLEAKEEILQVRKEVKDNHESLERAHPHRYTNPDQSPVMGSCTVNHESGKPTAPNSSEGIAIKIILKELVEGKTEKSFLGNLLWKEDESEPHVVYRIKRSAPLMNLMYRYCQKIDRWDVSFYHDGRRICMEQTADELQIKDGDVINAVDRAQYG